MELNESKRFRGSPIYEERTDNEIKQCCILKDIKFHAVDENYDGIVLTPVCEIYQKKADYLTIARIIPLDLFYESFLINSELDDDEIIGLKPLSNTKYSKCYYEFIDKYLKNKVIRYYFLPTDNEKMYDFIIDFNLVESIGINNFSDYKKVAEVCSPWKEDIIASYASYCVRIGTEEFSKQYFEKMMHKISRIRKN